VNQSETSTRNEESATLESVSIGDAARRLGVSVRTIQRRLDKGDLQAHHDGETRRVMLPVVARHDTTPQATHDILSRDKAADSRSNQGDSTRRDATTTRQFVTRHDAPEGDTRHDTSALLLVEKDERIADLRAVIESQKLQIEAANRQAAEATAALREYLKLQAKALPETTSSTRHEGETSREDWQEAPINAATGKVPQDAKNAALIKARREMRPLWKVILGVR
jgi:excisionase family DNA binding protein